MKFNTEIESRFHPTARHIPWPMIKEIFFYELETLHIDLICAPLQQLVSQPINSPWLHRDDNRLRAWLCIALAHPTISDQQLLDIAFQIQLSRPFIAQGAAFIGRLTLFNDLIQKDRNIIKSFSSNDYFIFRLAVALGQFSICYRISELIPDEVRSIARARDYEAFRVACATGENQLIRRLLESTYPDRRPTLTTRLKRVVTFAPEINDLQNMLHLEAYETYALSDYKAHYSLIVQIAMVAPAEVRYLIRLGSYYIFQQAVEFENALMIDGLVEIAPDEVQFMIQAGGYKAARVAARQGDLNILTRLFALAPTEILNMIQANTYEIFHRLVAMGEPERLNVLIGHAPMEMLLMLRSQEYEAVIAAAANGHLMMLNCFMAMVDQRELSRILQVRNYGVFEAALLHNQSEIVSRLLVLAGDIGLDMLRANRALLLNITRVHRNFNLIKICFMFPAVFADAELQTDIYGPEVERFVIEKLIDLRERHQIVEQSPNSPPFNIHDPDEILLCFYMIRHLIRCGDTTRHDELAFLAYIPAVNALLHTEVTPNQANELLRLAITRNAHMAVDLLYSMPEVRRLAIENQYYRANAESGSFDLWVLVQNSESSMEIVSDIERQQFNRLTTHYQPTIDQLGVESLLDSLRAWLVTRYEQDPAVIRVDDRIVSLPVNWADFEQLALTSAQRNEALQRYYENKTHSALRYLMIPNRWIDENSRFVLSNPTNNKLRWADYTYFKSFIVLLWIAAKDENSPPINQYTMEGRLLHFIDELALLARAHNWDMKRPKKDANGAFIYHIKRDAAGIIQYDVLGQPILEQTIEEYDDKRPDRPSCSSGVKKRLAQALVGHMLLCLPGLESIRPILTQAMIDQALRDFVVIYFRGKINAKNRQILKDSWENYLIDLDPNAVAPLKILNIPLKEQAKFIDNLSNQYGQEFRNQPLFKLYLEGQFSLRETRDPMDSLHLFKFSTWLGEVTMRQLFESPAILRSRDFNVFKTDYFTAYQAQFFKNPFSTMKVGLTSGRINCMADVLRYAEQHPSSRTAKLLLQ